MLDEALLFVKRNMRTKTIISPTTGRRTDRTDYPITAVREAIINALVHRDYSIHTEGMPIQLIMFEDRIEIHNPGGLYGRITIDQLGKIQPDTRNPVLASALETLGITENRYSGIPTIRMEMEKYNLRQPEFLDERGSFIVKLYKESKNDYEDMSNDEETNNLKDSYSDIIYVTYGESKYYWLGSAYQTNNVWCMIGDTFDYNSCESDYSCGVRPVIEIYKSAI